MIKDKCLCVTHGINTADTIEELKTAVYGRNISLANIFLKDLDSNIKYIEKDCGTNLGSIHLDIEHIKNKLNSRDYDQTLVGAMSILGLIKEGLKKCP